MEVGKQTSLSSIWEDSIEAVLQGFSVGFQQDGVPVASGLSVHLSIGFSSFYILLSPLLHSCSLGSLP